LLRSHIAELGYTRWFSIYDDDDSMSVIKGCIAQMGLSEKQCPARVVRSRISDAKNRMLTAAEVLDESDDQMGAWAAEIYKRYDAQLRNSNALDFDDLLTKTLELFSQRPQILAYYQQRFRYIHVDEYQDTNKAQYMLVQLLAAYHRNICVVGDDDQSIYGWRGADIRNILDFEKDFSDATVIRLEQNYRSTARILDAANGVIAHNTARKQKRLWTAQEGGEKVCVYQAHNEKDEAQFCLRTMAGLLGEYSYADFAILYRTNAQARAIEDALVLTGVPYQVYGGMRFYDRREIRDTLAYLRVLANPLDTVALKRIINVPKRGIGVASIAKLEGEAERRGISLWDALCDRDLIRDQTPRIASSVHVFTTTLQGLQQQIPHKNLLEFIDAVLVDTGYEGLYRLSEDDDSQERLENLKEFRSAAAEFMQNNDDAQLANFLENVALVADVDALDETRGTVTLMTLHSAKGLEFPVVFIVGMEDGIFPTSRALDDYDKLEEERRLCYVGITRARQRLYLVHCQSRLLYGEVRGYPVSRFLQEIPTDCVHHAEEDARAHYAAAQGRIFGARSKAARAAKPTGAFKPGFIAAPKKPKPSSGLKTGDKVRHGKFGRGTIIKVDQRGERRIFTIAFEGMGIKELMESVAPLEKL
ncbi:MAG: exodeoxyribonuclease V subunit gamma, partial [Eubacteriales bacterium]|nr:exodeoxyribonuclease V subunit gamma [Eubacteriales bacterium]